jgi:methionyl-tRNA synthetase
LAETEPWKLAKTDLSRTATILHLSLQIAANLAIAFEPFLPFSSKKLREMLNLQSFNWNDLGRTDLLAEGTSLGAVELLFTKIEDAEVDAQVQRLLEMKKANEAAEWKPEAIASECTIDDFAKLDIRCGTVLECQKVPKADKLLQFKIDDGMGGRTIVSGIAQSYKPEELVGLQVCFIANFPPRKLKGVESQGMILSAVNSDGKLVVISPSKKVANGSKVG